MDKDWSEPASDIHRQFAGTLGITCTGRLTEKELCLLIIEKRAEDRADKSPTREQFLFAANLGMDFEPCTIKAWELLRQLSAEIAFRSKRVLAEHKKIAPGLEVRYKGVDYVVTTVSLEDWRATIKPVLGGRQKRIYVMTIADILNGVTANYWE